MQGLNRTLTPYQIKRPIIDKSNQANCIQCRSNPSPSNYTKKESIKIVKMTNKSALVRTLREDMAFNSWAPELINGRCAMIGFVSGYGYEIVNNESLYQQFQDMYPYFVAVYVLIAIATLKSGKPTSEDVKINGLTPEAELFNGRAAMLGVSGTILYEMLSNSLSI